MMIGTIEQKKETVIVFNYNDEKAEYEELEIDDDFPLYELLESDRILLYIDKKKSKVWHWIGSNTTTRMKFIAAKLVENTRNNYGISFRIIPVDEGSEPKEFKILVGLDVEADVKEENTGPTYKGTIGDDWKFDSIKVEEILLKLEKNDIPTDYERRFVIVNNHIYAYKEYNSNYYGASVKEKKLFPLKGNVKDGNYILRECLVRLNFKNNKLDLIEILQNKEGLFI